MLDTAVPWKLAAERQYIEESWPAFQHAVVHLRNTRILQAGQIAAEPELDIELPVHFPENGCAVQ